MPLSKLESQDLTHRWGSSWVSYTEKTGAKSVALFETYLNDAPDLDELDFLSPTENYCLVKRTSAFVLPTEAIDFVAPPSRYFNGLFGGQQMASFLHKTGARHYKKGLVLTGPDSSRTYDLSCPLKARIASLNYFATNYNFFTSTVPVIWANTYAYAKLSKTDLLLNVYRMLVDPGYFSLRQALSELASKIPSIAISDRLCLCIPSNSEFNAELYYGLIPIGFYKKANKSFYVNAAMQQEITDYLIRNEETSYEVVAI